MMSPRIAFDPVAVVIDWLDALAAPVAAFGVCCAWFEVEAGRPPS
jgi:hypothetical protein